MRKPSLSAAKSKRDGGSGAVLLIPHCVLDSAAYMDLSGRAIKLLLDLAHQYNLKNNGALLASFNYMSTKRGWTSADQLTKAKRELVDHDLIAETVKGHRPNKASWFALTWLALDSIAGLEISTQAFPRGAYRHWAPPQQDKFIRKPRRENASI